MKPSVEEVIFVLGGLAACIAIPAADKQGARFVRGDAEVQGKYLAALDVLQRYWQP